MNKDLGFSAYIYGWGAGIFFFSYFLFVAAIKRANAASAAE